MALRPVETFQCDCCERYGRLLELLNVEIVGDVVKMRVSEDGYGGYLGDCPHCGFEVCKVNVC